jgi:hypothetical protein
VPSVYYSASLDCSAADSMRLLLSTCLCLTVCVCRPQGARGQHSLLPPPIAVMLMCELSSLACDAMLLMGELRPTVQSVCHCALQLWCNAWRIAVAQCRGAAA